MRRVRVLEHQLLNSHHLVADHGLRELVEGLLSYAVADDHDGLKALLLKQALDDALQVFVMQPVVHKVELLDLLWNDLRKDFGQRVDVGGVEVVVDQWKREVWGDLLKYG